MLCIVFRITVASRVMRFEEFAADFPYTITCDYKKWETQAAKDYHVSSSPTIFLLDSNNKIIQRSPTIASLDSWLD